MEAKVDASVPKTLQVIGAGYSRTGTVSFSKALERLLGGPVCHSGTACLLREEGWRSSFLPLQSQSHLSHFLCQPSSRSGYQS